MTSAHPGTAGSPGASAAGVGAPLGVSLRGLVVVYRSEGHDVAALSGVDLLVSPGEVIGLLGPSGAGKSTLMAVLGGIVPPTAGQVRVGTTELSKLTEAQLDRYLAMEVGLVLQGAARNLVPYLTPRGNVDFAQAAARRTGRTLAEPDDILDLLGISDLAERSLPTLSPGQLQLVALAVGIAPSPGLLLADEPTSQLDHASRDRVLDTLDHINSTLGTTIVVVTHDPDVAARLPRTVTIRDGRIGGEGRLGEEFSIVSADGSLPLPEHALERFTPGSLVRVAERDGELVLRLAVDE